MFSLSNTKVAFRYLDRSKLVSRHNLFRLLRLISRFAALRMLFFKATRFSPVRRRLVLRFIEPFYINDPRAELDNLAALLWKSRLFTLPLYIPENLETNNANTREYNVQLDRLKGVPHVPFYFLRLRAIINPRLLVLLQSDLLLNRIDLALWEGIREWIDGFCFRAIENGQGVIIDLHDVEGEPIEKFITDLTIRYNRNRVWIYIKQHFTGNSSFTALIKTYRTIIKREALPGFYLEEDACPVKSFFPLSGPRLRSSGVKEVTGALNRTVKFLLSNINNAALIICSHDIDRILYVSALMGSMNLSPGDNRVVFAQYYGLADTISFNLSESGYNVLKLVSYGNPGAIFGTLSERIFCQVWFSEVIARENRLIEKELQRRKTDI